MPDYNRMADIARLARDHGPIRISSFELMRMFMQPERKTSLGDGIMNFCGLPTERESYERWLLANELIAIEDVKSQFGDVTLTRKRESK